MERLLKLTGFILLLLAAGCKDRMDSTETIQKNDFKKVRNMYRKLTPREEQIIVHKGTERPFTGKYDDFFEEGLYICRRCGKALFESSAKFTSYCGWPSFDEQIPGAVISQQDADGRRTENICANCGGHLGHVFKGEGYTEKNTRFCINSISMDFVSKGQRAIFAGGCFWGVEYHFENVPGVISVTSGYIGGGTEKPTYEQVCSGKTGHAEAVEIVYNPAQTNYEKLTKLFFEIHDFTLLNRQGPDIGTQYRSGIYYLDNEQKEIAAKLVNALREKGYNVKTEIKKADTFWPAEQYHQDYYERTGKAPYCHSYKKIF
ncbi:MAG: bifunctional methionine sulfoxide reductase B/A protein [Sedimentisphaerales bacterium]|nr:bifunctional methionine sulfoxide reductase B/A protein [Sedimentisphaerales bacterium]